MTEPFRIYFAGDLFDHKDLIGNSILQSHIEKISEGRYCHKTWVRTSIRRVYEIEITRRFSNRIWRCLILMATNWIRERWQNLFLQNS